MVTKLAEIHAQMREQFQKQREEALAKLEEADAELRALDAYDAAKAGNAAISPQPQPSKRTGAPRETRGGIRADVLLLIQANPKGLTAKEINRHLGAEDDKGKKQSIANALGILKESGHIKQAVRRAPYLPATPQQVLDDVTTPPEEADDAA